MIMPTNIVQLRRRKRRRKARSKVVKQRNRFMSLAASPTTPRRSWWHGRGEEGEDDHDLTPEEFQRKVHEEAARIGAYEVERWEQTEVLSLTPPEIEAVNEWRRRYNLFTIVQSLHVCTRDECKHEHIYDGVYGCVTSGIVHKCTRHGTPCLRQYRNSENQVFCTISNRFLRLEMNNNLYGTRNETDVYVANTTPQCELRKVVMYRQDAETQRARQDHVRTRLEADIARRRAVAERAAQTALTVDIDHSSLMFPGQRSRAPQSDDDDEPSDDGSVGQEVNLFDTDYERMNSPKRARASDGSSRPSSVSQSSLPPTPTSALASLDLSDGFRTPRSPGMSPRLTELINKRHSHARRRKTPARGRTRRANGDYGHDGKPLRKPVLYDSQNPEDARIHTVLAQLYDTRRRGQLNNRSFGRMQETMMKQTKHIEHIVELVKHAASASVGQISNEHMYQLVDLDDAMRTTLTRHIVAGMNMCNQLAEKHSLQNMVGMPFSIEIFTLTFLEIMRNGLCENGVYLVPALKFLTQTLPPSGKFTDFVSDLTMSNGREIKTTKQMNRCHKMINEVILLSTQNTRDFTERQVNTYMSQQIVQTNKYVSGSALEWHPKSPTTVTTLATCHKTPELAGVLALASSIAGNNDEDDTSEDSDDEEPSLARKRLDDDSRPPVLPEQRAAVHIPLSDRSLYEVAETVEGATIDERIEKAAQAMASATESKK